MQLLLLALLLLTQGEKSLDFSSLATVLPLLPLDEKTKSLLSVLTNFTNTQNQSSTENVDNSQVIHKNGQKNTELSTNEDNLSTNSGSFSTNRGGLSTNSPEFSTGEFSGKAVKTPADNVRFAGEEIMQLLNGILS